MGTTVFPRPLDSAVSGKADKVSSATTGNFAALDSNGNLTDSGHKHSDYLTSHQDISGKQDKTDSSLTTTAQTVVGAINENNTAIGNLGDMVFPTKAGTPCGNGENFNNKVTPGVYTVSTNAIAGNITNCPVAKAGRLCVWSPTSNALNNVWAVGEQLYYVPADGAEYRRRSVADGSGVITWGGWDTVAKKSEVASVKSFDHWTAIEANTDLNNLSDPGAYGSDSTATTSTLSNCPVSTGFSLMVLKKSNAYHCQIITNGSSMFMRDRTSGGWWAWERLALNSNFTRETGTCTAGTNITLNDVFVEKSGNVCVLHGMLSITGTVAGNNAVVLTIPSGFRPSSILYVRLWATYGGTLSLTKFYLSSNGSLVSNRGNSTLSDTIQLEITYII